MKNWTPVFLIAGIAVYVIFGEYTQLKSSIGQSTQRVNELTDETKATVRTIRETIDDLRGKFLRLESQYETLETQLQTKVVEPAPEPEQKTITPTIVMHSGYSCAPCNNWIVNEKPKWEKSGWFVEVKKEIESTRSWPWFRITNRKGVEFEVDGPLTNDNFIDAQRKASK